jgi:two-component system, chemotaxis family, CheB/CheR fusion protein
MTRRPDPDVEALIAHLGASRGVDVGQYRRSTLLRRFARRMQSLGIDGHGEYLDHLEVHPDEFGLLLDMLLVNVTGFFRDPQAWSVLASEVIPRLVADGARTEPLRVWCAGCASGEEAYTLAMVLAEAMGPDEVRQRVKIYATDVDEAALTRGRHGVYGAREAARIPPGLLERYFERSGASYAVRTDLRRSVVFGRHDLTTDPPISRLSLLVCRNTLMYFDVEAQAQILRRFQFGLGDGGVLFLGKTETLLAHVPAFVPLDLEHRIFTIGDRALRRLPAADHALDPRRGAGTLVQIAWEESPIPELVVDSDGSLAAANGRARALLRLKRADVGRPLRDLELSHQPPELRSSIQRALADGVRVAVPDVAWPSDGHGAPVRLAFEIAPLPPGARQAAAVVVTVHDVTEQRRLEDELNSSSRQLETAYEGLQSTNEELEAMNRELRSTIEELETTNRELQSTDGP